MPDAPDLTTFFEEIEKRKAARAAADKPNPVISEFPDLIPDAPYEGRSEEDTNIDHVLDRLTVLEAYNRWCGKMRPRVRPGQRESIMISCPNPSHVDSNPSAWINLDKNVWTCGGCGFE